jgi:hypothetical protein
MSGIGRTLSKFALGALAAATTSCSDADAGAETDAGTQTVSTLHCRLTSDNGSVQAGNEQIIYLDETARKVVELGGQIRGSCVDFSTNKLIMNNSSSNSSYFVQCSNVIGETYIEINRYSGALRFYSCLAGSQDCVDATYQCEKASAPKF